MTTLHRLAVGLAFGGLLFAIAAAHYWWRASQVAIRQPVASISDVPELHIASGQVAFNESSRLNATAAILTGISAVLSALGSVLGVF
ncbi:hypothetical protein ACVIIV_002803 [Bradyrhizobium sp. USDA 4354]